MKQASAPYFQIIFNIHWDFTSNNASVVALLHLNVSGRFDILNLNIAN